MFSVQLVIFGLVGSISHACRGTLTPFSSAVLLWLSQGFGQVLSVTAAQMCLFWHQDCGCNATQAFICGQPYEHQGQRGGSPSA